MCISSWVKEKNMNLKRNETKKYYLHRRKYFFLSKLYGFTSLFFKLYFTKRKILFCVSGNNVKILTRYLYNVQKCSNSISWAVESLCILIRGNFTRIRPSRKNWILPEKTALIFTLKIFTFYFFDLKVNMIGILYIVLWDMTLINKYQKKSSILEGF